MSSDSPGDRARVYDKIAPTIMEFHQLHAGETFHAEQLRTFVRERVPGIAPDSPGRILRALRLEGRLDYAVLDRANSLYQFRALKPDPDPFEKWWEFALPDRSPRL
jgi:hypothetical protein